MQGVRHPIWVVEYRLLGARNVRAPHLGGRVCLRVLGMFGHPFGRYRHLGARNVHAHFGGRVSPPGCKECSRTPFGGRLSPPGC